MLIKQLAKLFTGSSAAPKREAPPISADNDNVPQETVNLGSPYRLTVDGNTVPVPFNGKSIDIGRDSDSFLRVSSREVSRHHAQVRFQNGDLQIRDSGSTNGTFINGESLKSKDEQWLTLKSHDQISLAGAAKLEVQDTHATLVEFPESKPWPSQTFQVGKDWVESAASNPKLEAKENYRASLSNVSKVLDTESGLARASSGVPTIIVPDIHGRRDFISAVLNYELDGQSVMERLHTGRVNLVCLGDVMHSEGRRANDWRQAAQLAFEGKTEESNKVLDPEGVDSLGAARMVMDLKSSFPTNFFFIRGNHEDVHGGFGKYAFAKNGEQNVFIGEAPLTKAWMQDRLGPEFPNQFAEQFENKLPLAVDGEGYLASHIASDDPLSLSEVENRTPRAQAELTWTNNVKPDVNGKSIFEQTAGPVFQENLNNLAQNEDVWFVGHRPVKDHENDGLYRTQMGGKLVQINRPDEFIIAKVGPQGEFDRSKDVIRLNPDGSPVS